jgi:hypothetical protein
LTSASIPRLYIVTDRGATGGRPLAAVVGAALAGAVRGGLAGHAVAVQLREKDLDGRALRQLAADMRALTRAFGAALYVNDRIDVALAVGADGVHLAGTSLSPVDARALAPQLRIAASAHAATDLDGLEAGPGRLRRVRSGPRYTVEARLWTSGRAGDAARGSRQARAASRDRRSVRRRRPGDRRRGCAWAGLHPRRHERGRSRKERLVSRAAPGRVTRRGP